VGHLFDDGVDFVAPHGEAADVPPKLYFAGFIGYSR
jgi:hypothetical protein